MIILSGKAVCRFEKENSIAKNSRPTPFSYKVMYIWELNSLLPFLLRIIQNLSDVKML